jgi:hypothetical protein
MAAPMPLTHSKGKTASPPARIVFSGCLSINDQETGDRHIIERAQRSECGSAPRPLQRTRGLPVRCCRIDWIRCPAPGLWD